MQFQKRKHILCIALILFIGLFLLPKNSFTGGNKKNRKTKRKKNKTKMQQKINIESENLNIESENLNTIDTSLYQTPEEIDTNLDTEDTIKKNYQNYLKKLKN